MADQVSAALERLQQHRRAPGRRRRPAARERAVKAPHDPCPACSSTMSLNTGDERLHVRSKGSKAAENERYAWDSTGASCRCSATGISRGIDGEAFEQAITEVQDRSRRRGGRADLDTDALKKELTDQFKSTVPSSTDEDFHRTRGSSYGSIRAVFDFPGPATARRSTAASTASRTAEAAVDVQQMVFGNKGDIRARASRSARDEVTGARARPATSRRTPRARTSSPARARRATSREMKDWLPAAYAADGHPARARAPLRGHAGHRVHGGGGAACTYCQTRSAKRPAQAAVRFARDAVDEGLLRPRATCDDRRRDARRAPGPDVRPQRPLRADHHGRARPRPGRRQGRGRLHRAATPSTAAAEGRDVHPRPPGHQRQRRRAASTPPRASSPASGARRSHAALVARGMGVPCVTGRLEPEDQPRGPAASASAIA